MIYVYQCPLCKKKWRSNTPHEPCCTGPSESRDEHEMTVMLLIESGDVLVHPLISKQKADGPLILPEHYFP